MGWITDAVGLLTKGGFVMIPLLLCSVVSITVLLERFVKIKRAQADVASVVNRAEEALCSGQDLKAITLLESVDTPVTRVLAAGVRNKHLGERGVERAMEERGTRETTGLTRHLGLLDTIITVSPLLGLLGTVTGMISAFHVMAAKDGISTPTAITGGVGEALIATATGLAIAIITLVGHNHLQEQVKHIISDIEARATAFVNMFTENIQEERIEIKSLSA